MRKHLLVIPLTTIKYNATNTKNTNQQAELRTQNGKSSRGETLWNKVSAGLTTQCLSDCVYTCTSSCFTSCLCLNFLCIVFTVYANSVILNKTSVSGVRMIDYGSQARSPQWGKEACLTSAVNTISVLYECHQQSNDLLLGRVCSIFSPLLSLSLSFSCLTKLHIFWRGRQKYPST